MQVESIIATTLKGPIVRVHEIRMEALYNISFMEVNVVRPLTGSSNCSHVPKNIKTHFSWFLANNEFVPDPFREEIAYNGCVVFYLTNSIYSCGMKRLLENKLALLSHSRPNDSVTSSIPFQ